MVKLDSFAAVIKLVSDSDSVTAKDAQFDANLASYYSAKEYEVNGL